VIYTDIAVEVRKHIRQGLAIICTFICNLQNASRKVQYFDYEASPFVFTPHQYYSGNPIRKNDGRGM
jgi:hypothetical protein